MTELPERLRDAAAAHRPDRERMLARVERAMGAPAQPAGALRRERTPVPWARTTAVAAAAVGVLGAGGLAVAAVTGDSEPGGAAVTSTAPNAPPQRAATGGGPAPEAGRPGLPRAHGTGAPEQRTGARPGYASPAGQPRSSSAPTASPSAPGPDLPDRPSPSAPPAPPSSPGAALGAADSLDSAGDASWTRSDVVVTARQEITGLTVELRVALTAGVAGTGSFTSVAGRTTVSVAERDGYLVFRWTLDPGQTLEAGTYSFAGQFCHATGPRATAGDGYTVSGTANGGPVTVTGAF